MSEKCQLRKSHDSFDHVVGAGEERGRDNEVQRLRSLKINHQLQLGWELHWQIPWRNAMQDFVDKVGSAPKARAKIDSIANQPTGIDMLAISIDGGYPRCRHHRRNFSALA